MPEITTGDFADQPPDRRTAPASRSSTATPTPTSRSRRTPRNLAALGAADGRPDAGPRPRRRRPTTTLHHRAGDPSTTTTTAAGGHHDDHDRGRPDQRAADAGRRARRGLRHPPPPAHAAHPKQMLPVVQPADDRAGRRAPRPATASTTAVLSLGYRPDAFQSTPTPTARCAGVRAALRRRARAAATPPAPSASPPLDAGIDERFLVRQRRRAHRPRHRRPRGASTSAPAPRARSPCTAVEDPSAFGVVPTDADGRVDRVHREAAARRGAHRPDQRRHLRARAVACSTASRPTCR